MIINPILVHMIRGDMVESFFRGAYAVVDARGRVIDAQGDIDRRVYPRSALKPIQALGVIESGAADTYNLSIPEIAVACASHNGEDSHVTIVNQWLEKLGLSYNVLECGVHISMRRETALTHARQRQKLTFAHNACSGKHAAFVTQALHLKVPVQGYTNWDHPVQQYVNRIIEDVIEIDVAAAPKGIDGCQVPVIGMPLKNLAQGMAKLACPQTLKSALANAVQRMVAAIQAYPELIAGTGRFCSALVKESDGRLVGKMGADGVFTVIVPEKGWGIALKIDDGNLVAAEVAIMGILKKHGLLPEKGGWDRWANPVITNWNNQAVGQISFVG